MCRSDGEMRQGGVGVGVHLASYNWNAEYSTDLSPPLIYFDVFQLRNNYRQTVSVLLPILQIRCTCTVGRMMEKVGDRRRRVGGGGGGKKKNNGGKMGRWRHNLPPRYLK